MDDEDYNYGGLKDEVESEQNVIYYRRGKDEMSINITNKCPNACLFCIRDKDEGWGVSNLYLDEDPTLEEIREKTKEEVEQNDTEITKVKICGYGEPLIRMDILPEIVKLVREQLPETTIQLTTTGWPVYSIENGVEKFEKCAENGLDRIYLSTHAVDEEDYNKVVRPAEENSFEKVVDFLKLSKKLDMKVVCSFVDVNVVTEEEIKEFTEKHDVAYDIRELEG